MASSPPPVDPAGSPELAGAALTGTRAFVVAFDDRLRYANPAAVRAWGHDRDELVGAPLAPLLHPDSRRQAAELAIACAGGGHLPREIVLRIRRRDGRHRRLRLAVSTIELGGRALVLTTGLEADDEHRTRQRLRRSEESLALVQQAARSVYWEWEPDDDRLTVTRFADELFGFSVHNVARTGAEFVDLVHPEDRERLRRALVASLKEGEDLALELRFITPAGEIRWLSERGVAVRGDDGRTRRIIGVAQDISERKVAEEALFLEKDKADVTLASIAEGVLRTDERGMIDYLNPVAQRLTGWSLAEAYGRPAEEVYRVVDGETGERLLDPLTQCLSDRRQSIFAGDRTLADRNGGLHPVQDSAAPIRSRGGEIIGAVLVFRDLSRLREIEREIDRLASHDPLTGLINRRAFAAEIERAVSEARGEARRHALCHFDLDNFRLINETGGESAGDRLIQETARLIRAHLGDADVLAHLGGDAFGVLFRDSTPERAHEIADEIRRAIRATRFATGERSFSTAVSVGVVAIGPEPIDPTALLRDAEADGAAALLRDADAACLVAKERGGDRIHSYQAGDSAIAERYGQMQWIARISDAFDDDRFVLFHQSIVPLYEGGADEPPFYELLVRLVDDSGELVGPGSFIPAAERFGMISRIDRWVLRNALRVLAAGGPSGDAEPRFTINVSGFSLGAADFLDLVIAELDETGVDPARVLFEITETAAIADLARARRFLTALKGRGCKFILDDFGKGLSSLGYLRNLPLDYLKIDGSFVRNITVDPIQTALVASIHEIGDVMGLRTIAESVEDEDTLEAVRRIGIDYAQGFLLARPEPLVGGWGQGGGTRGLPLRLEPRAPHRYKTN